MNAAAHAQTKTPPSVNIRIIIHDLSVCLRFFDGNDFMKENPTYESTSIGRQNNVTSRKDELLGALLDTDYISATNVDYIPIVEDEFFTIRSQRNSRDQSHYFETILDRVRLRIDSFIETSDHHLTSCLDLKITSLFLSETVSRGYPKKMLGEWINDYEHPRDNKHGVIMLKVSCFEQPVSRNNFKLRYMKLK